MTGTSSMSHVTNRRTPSPETHANADPPPTPDKGIRGVTLEIYGDGPLEVWPGVVAPAGYYIVIDGAAGDQYEAAQGFPTWYGPYGAEHYMRAGSTARSFQWIPGEETPIHRADAMERALRRRSLKPPTHEAMQEERYDPWGRREATSLFKEVGDSAETAYHSDMYVTSEMANRW